MKAIIEYDFSRFTVLVFLIFVLIIFVTLRLIKFLLPRLEKKHQSLQQIFKHFSSFELFIWLIFLFWSLPYFYGRNIFYAIGLSFIIAIILGYIGWFAIKDVIAGFVLRNNNSIAVNKKITTNNITLTISKINLTNIEGRLENGDLIYIRYSKLISDNFRLLTENEQTYNKTIELKIATKNDNHNYFEKIKSFLIAQPGYAVKYDPEIIKTATDDKFTTLKITFYALDTENILNIEKAVKKMFSTE